MAQAKGDGAITWNYGNFMVVSKTLFKVIINFITVTAIVFLLVKIYTAAIRTKPPHKTHECPFCLKDIPRKATRCAFCTSDIFKDIGDLDRHRFGSNNNGDADIVVSS